MPHVTACIKSQLTARRLPRSLAGRVNRILEARENYISDHDSCSCFRVTDGTCHSVVYQFLVTTVYAVLRSSRKCRDQTLPLQTVSSTIRDRHKENSPKSAEARHATDLKQTLLY